MASDLKPGSKAAKTWAEINTPELVDHILDGFYNHLQARKGGLLELINLEERRNMIFRFDSTGDTYRPVDDVEEPGLKDDYQSGKYYTPIHESPDKRLPEFVKFLLTYPAEHQLRWFPRLFELMNPGDPDRVYTGNNSYSTTTSNFIPMLRTIVLEVHKVPHLTSTSAARKLTSDLISFVDGVYKLGTSRFPKITVQDRKKVFATFGIPIDDKGNFIKQQKPAAQNTASTSAAQSRASTTSVDALDTRPAKKQKVKTTAKKK